MWHRGSWSFSAGSWLVFMGTEVEDEAKGGSEEGGSAEGRALGLSVGEGSWPRRMST